MPTDKVSSFLRSTYKDDIFNYRGSAFSDVCNWVEAVYPDSIVFYKKLLKLIKDDEKKEDSKKLAKKDRNDANIDCWYLPLPIGNNKKIVVFYKKIYAYETNPLSIEKYDIYQFKEV